MNTFKKICITLFIISFLASCGGGGSGGGSGDTGGTTGSGDTGGTDGSGDTGGTDGSGDTGGTGSDTDTDGDTVLNENDNCPTLANTDQADLDGDDIGDLCDSDIDGDGLVNSVEEANGTSTILADTDGDGFTDQFEQNDGGFNPLVADLPKISIEVTDQPTIQLNVTDSSSNTNVGSYEASYEQGQQSSYSRSDTTATSATIEASTRVYAEAEVSGGITGPSGSAKAGAEASVSASATQEQSTSVTQNSARDSRQEFSKYTEDTNGLTSTTESGSLTTTLRITNISDVTFEVSRVEVIAKKRAGNSSSFQPVGTLFLETRDETTSAPQELGPGAMVEGLVTTDSPSIPLLKELMQNPSGLLFSVSNYELTNVGNEEGRSFARLSQDIGGRTAQVVIDYGENPFNGNDTVEQYMVATNVDRDSNGDPVGISMARVLNDILQISYSTQEQDVLDENNQTVGGQHMALSQVRGLASDSLETGFWYVFSNSQSLDDPAVNFDDIILKARDRITMVYLADADGDQLFNREEYLLGSNAEIADTDGDGLTDFEEVRNGWTINVDGVSRMVTSDPLSADVDGDSLTDDQERDMGTDPNNADTDLDGTDDANDVDPTGFSVLAIDMEFFGPTRNISAKGLITPPSDVTLIDATIDWGDGTAPNVIAKGDTQTGITVNTLHTYANDGDYDITLTVRSEGSPDETRNYSVEFIPRFSGDLGCCTFDDGFEEDVDTRFVEDINGDGRADIIAFGETGTWTALSNGVGFDNASLITTDFASGTSWDKTTQRRQLANVGGNSAPDIVMFATDGVYVAINDGAGNFSAASKWINDFGVDHGYLNFILYPRLVGDLNNDGFDDIAAIAAEGIYQGLSSGGAFISTLPVVPSFSLNNGTWNDDNPRLLADINGDNYLDLVGFGGSSTFIKLNNQDGSFANATSTPNLTTAQGYRVDRHIRIAADINNDGLDDLFATTNSGVIFIPSQGARVSSTYTWLSDDFGYNDGWRIPNDPRSLADINGDGLLDIVGFGPEKTNVSGGVYYALNTGNGEFFEPRQLWLTEFAYGQGDISNVNKNPRFTGDVNGDGQDDLIIFGDSNVTVVFPSKVD